MSNSAERQEQRTRCVAGSLSAAESEQQPSRLLPKMFTLNEVVPWGRSLDEYRRMFALTDDDMGRRILGCADGPASFNAEATALGCSVVSCDPIYRLDAGEIRRRIDQTFQTIMDQTRQNAAEFVWSEGLPNVEVLGQLRLAAMQTFLDDYDDGRSAGRYVEGLLPMLPFGDNSFDISVCSHLLFLYSEQLSEDFHVESIRELCRVSRDVRLFPLLGLGSVPSRHVSPVADRLREEGYHVEVEKVSYEFQRGGNQVMRVSR